MIRRFLLPLLAVLGFTFAVFSVVRGSRELPAAPPVAEPPRAPFDSYVAGAGIVEAATENIAIGTPVGNIVTEVLVKVGDEVKQGTPLFRLRDQVTQAELEAKRSSVNLARARLERLRSLPRAEEVAPLEARAKEAESLLLDEQSTLRFWESVPDQRAVSKDTLSRQRFAVESASARFAAARAELDALRAGAWKPDLVVAEAEVASAEAAVRQVEAEIERRTIRAPIDGVVLQVKVRPGEYAQPGPLATPLLLMGSTTPLHVRVDVDENDAWRIGQAARAEGVVRGNSRLRARLELVRIEPFVVPKRSLTGDSTERVDTRVLQLVYRFPREALPVYVGQQLDVFIEAAPFEGSSPAGEPGGGSR